MPILEFDPKKVGSLEYQSWRAHNDKNKLLLTQKLTEQNEALYGLTYEQAQEALGFLILAVKAHDDKYWGEAIVHATNYYRLIKDNTDFQFDPAKAGKLEVTWWQIHDELEHNPDKSKLTQAFADLYSEIFGQPLKRFYKSRRTKSKSNI